MSLTEEKIIAIDGIIRWAALEQKLQGQAHLT